MEELIRRWETLGRNGVIVSICYGWTRGGLAFSVFAAARGQEFEKPFTAHSFKHAVEIAETESFKRGWVAN